MVPLFRLVSGGVLLGTLSGAAFAVEQDWNASIGMETRLFFEAPAFPEQARHDAAGFGELEYRAFARHWMFSGKAFGRLDSADARRSAADLREAYFLVPATTWEVKAGVDRVFWGVAESVHLVDIVNQSDLVGDPTGETKLGQPMLQLTWLLSHGHVDAFVLPYFRKRPFPGRDGRLRPGIPVAHGDAEYESGAQRRHIDVAARYALQLDRWDVGLSYFTGTNRRPSLVPFMRDDGELRLRPYYSQIRQLGLDAQYTIDALLWKLEVKHRRGELNAQLEQEPYTAAVGGFEYTWFGAGGRGLDIGFLAEGIFDERGTRTNGVFGRAAFLGLRFGFRGVANTEILTGAVRSLEDDSWSLRVQADRRLGHNWTIQLEGLGFFDVPEDSLLHALRKDSHFRAQLVYWF